MSESEVNVLKVFLEERFDNIKEDFAEVNKRLDAIEKELHGTGNENRALAFGWIV